MIVADPKPLQEILDMITPFKNILIVGCKGCVTVCNVGGAKEVEILCATLKLAGEKEGRALSLDTAMLERQCDKEYVELLKDRVDTYDAVISMACGVGPQFLSEAYPDQRFFPAVNTTFYGAAVSHGIWEERCAGCGTILHGPCGGSSGGVCEVSKETVCIWDVIVKKKMAQGRLDDLFLLQDPRDWRSARDGGPRRSIRETLAE